jgi:hypothetical protein
MGALGRRRSCSNKNWTLRLRKGAEASGAAAAWCIAVMCESTLQLSRCLALLSVLTSNAPIRPVYLQSSQTSSSAALLVVVWVKDSELSSAE